MQNSKYNLKTEGKKKKERGIRRQICVFLCIGNTGMMMMHDNSRKKEIKKNGGKRWDASFFYYITLCIFKNLLAMCFNH